MAAGFDNQYVNEGLKAERGEKMGASWGDYDNDGYPDLFLANSRENQLYHNEGNGTFKDVTAQAGVAGVGPPDITVAGCFPSSVGPCVARSRPWLCCSSDSESRPAPSPSSDPSG